MRSCWGQWVREVSLPHSFPCFSRPSFMCFLRRHKQCWGRIIISMLHQSFHSYTKPRKAWRFYTDRLPSCNVFIVIFFNCICDFWSWWHFLAELLVYILWVFLPLNERNRVVHTRTSGLFTLVFGGEMRSCFVRSRISEWTHLRHLGSSVALFRASAALDGFTDTEDDCARLWLTEFYISLQVDFPDLLMCVMKVWWLLFLMWASL